MKNPSSSKAFSALSGLSTLGKPLMYAVGDNVRPLVGIKRLPLETERSEKRLSLFPLRHTLFVWWRILALQKRNHVFYRLSRFWRCLVGYICHLL